MDSPLNLFPDDQPVRDNRLRFLALLPPTDVARKIFAHAQRLDSDHDSSALVLRARNETNPELRNFHKRPGLALAERAGLKGVRFNLTPHITMLYASRGVTEDLGEPVGWTRPISSIHPAGGRRPIRGYAADHASPSRGERLVRNAGPCPCGRIHQRGL